MKGELLARTILFLIGTNLFKRFKVIDLKLSLHLIPATYAFIVFSFTFTFTRAHAQIVEIMVSFILIVMSKEERGISSSQFFSSDPSSKRKFLNDRLS